LSRKWLSHQSGVREQTADSRQQTADSRQQTADIREQRADSRQQTADSRQQTADSRQQTADSRQQAHRAWFSLQCGVIGALHCHIEAILVGSAGVDDNDSGNDDDDG
jgi:hypothetical protein